MARNMVRGAEDAPKIVALEDIYSIGVRGSSRQRQMIAEIIKVLEQEHAPGIIGSDPRSDQCR